MREILIPCIYDANGVYLTVCGLRFDDNNKIIEVDHWSGDGVVTYKEGEFGIEESDRNLLPLYQETRQTPGVKKE